MNYRRIFVTILFAGSVCFGQEVKLIPVNKWPRVIFLPGKQVINPSVEQCIDAGYRLMPESKPITPKGKRIKTEQLIQDPEDETKVKYEIVYENIPVKPIPPPLVITNVSSDRVEFKFTTNGIYIGAVWLDAPRTNRVEQE